MQINASGSINKNTPASRKSRFLRNVKGSSGSVKSRNMDMINPGEASPPKNSSFSSHSEIAKRFNMHNPSNKDLD